ncbi:peptidase domain-containing ABC transporter [Pontimicrobium sp. IMCC45349]|uniref:peptidase domain-containing ABC transporter n=1 Tax=Pontimicrobium sp. IMCC45349 TaxID=3391574 RepID=UPI0039A2C729
MTPWQRLLGLVKLEKKDIYQVFNYAIFSGLVALSLPLGIQAIVNLIQGAQISTSWIVLVILVTIGVIFSGILQLMQLKIIESIQQRIFMRASFELSYRFPKIKFEELRNYYPPELANRFFDTITIQKGLAKILIDIPTALLQIVFALILLSFYHPFFILFGLLVLALVFMVFKYTAKQGLMTSLKESKYKYRVAHWIQEIARSVISFKLSGRTNLAVEKNDSLVVNYLEARQKHFGVLMLQFIQMIGFKVIITAGLLIVGGFLVINQEMNIGQFVAAEIIILIVIASVEKLILSLEPFYDVLTAIEKLGQVVDKDLENQHGNQPNFIKDFNVELQNVGYSVEDREMPILLDISLKINSKSRILIQGETGSGKSSLLSLISGVIKPTKGHLFINGLSSESILINHYRAHLGLSINEEAPFEGTIRENISFGDKTISDEDILWAMEKANLSDFLKVQPKGLSTKLYPEGKRISYTVSKKIILARAIVKKPKLLILEDALDQFNIQETNTIIDFLTDKSNPWGVIVISNNKYWTQKCTEVKILSNGKITN